MESCERPAVPASRPCNALSDTTQNLDVEVLADALRDEHISDATGEGLAVSLSRACVALGNTAQNLGVEVLADAWIDDPCNALSDASQNLDVEVLADAWRDERMSDAAGEGPAVPVSRPRITLGNTALNLEAEVLADAMGVITKSATSGLGLPSFSSRLLINELR